MNQLYYQKYFYSNYLDNLQRNIIYYYLQPYKYLYLIVDSMSAITLTPKKTKFNLLQSIQNTTFVFHLNNLTVMDSSLHRLSK